MPDDLILKQLVVVVDARTSSVCLNAAGQIRPVDAPFTTSNGDFDSPPFHIHCRSFVVPYLAGAAQGPFRALAEQEKRNRTPARLESTPPRPRKPKPVRRRRVRR